MGVVLTIIVAAVVLGCLARLTLSALGLRAAARLPRLAELTLPAPSRWPSVSLLVPACNEAAAIEAALGSKLNQDYPDLQVVVVDDRSTDGTGIIVDRLAVRDPRVSVLHIKDLPQGWLGKVHALNRGMTRVTGDWVLLSDADVHLTPDTIRRAVAFAEVRELDFLTAVPEFSRVSFLVDAMLADLVRSLLPILQPDWLERPKSRLAVGGGAFMLVRRTAYDRTPGFESLKLEVIDDMAFGQMMKDAGARCGIVIGRGLLHLAFYTSVADAARGSEKAFASVGRCSLARLLLFVGLTLFVNLAPYLSLALSWPWWLRPVASLAVVLDLAGSIAMNRAVGGRASAALVAPVGALVMAALLLRSAWLAFRRGGARWRGTLYRTEALRAGMRYRFPWG